MVTSRPKAYSYIRMSRDTQLKGDSLRRQREACDAYAMRNGLELVDDFALEDIGVSGWTGKNLQSGNLGRFLEAVRNGEVERGSYLLVEAFDRISRQEPIVALQPFLDLINNGIVLVTLDDEKLFTRETIKFEDLIISIAKMSRANEESVRKSDRVSKAWANKRSKASEIKLTKRCPGWLKLSEDRRSFDVIEDRARIVRRIFEETVSGIGVYTIARRLNAAGVPCFGKSKGWQLSSLHKIINSRAAIGEFQPSRLVNGQREPDGKPISNYFPAIVESDLFHAAHHARAERREAGGGRTGKRVSNLFSKIAVCRECDGPMHFESKGSGPRGGTYLVCDNARRNLGCISVRWRYNDFEASFLAFVAELDLGSLLKTDSDGVQRAELERQLDALRGQIGLLEDERAAAFELHRRGISIEFVGRRMAETDEKISGVKERIDTITKQLARNAEAVHRYYESKDRLHDLIVHLRQQSGDEVYKQRSLVAARLKAIIDKVIVSPSTTRTFAGNARELLGLANFEVCFRNGVTRIVYPDPANPLKFARQFIGSGPELDIIEADGSRYPMDDGYEPEEASGGEALFE